uniref:Uncharacterized protein n=1 Tax=Knipowitschia caucasica TaxID=637954 RepID=A0AAV2L9R8_KNICA
MRTCTRFRDGNRTPRPVQISTKALPHVRRRSAQRPSQITIRGGRPVARQLPGAMSRLHKRRRNLAAPEHPTQHQHDSPAPHPRRHQARTTDRRGQLARHYIV